MHAGPVGAGHFTKMVHNGIEYGIMQAYGEGYELLKAVDLVTDPDAVMASWQEGTVIRSWLLDLLVLALEDDPGLAEIRGYAQDSGEGRWTIEAAIENAVPMPVITSALFARFASRQDDSPAMKVVAALRNQFGGHAVGPRTSRPRASPPRPAPDAAPPGPRPDAAVYVRHLSLTDFRSWATVEVALEPGVNVLVGPNGTGKTNLVEALGYLATLSSHRVAADAPLIRRGADPGGRPGGGGVRRPGAAARGGDRPGPGQPGPDQPGPADRAAGHARRAAHGAVRARGPGAGPRRPDRTAPVPGRGADHAGPAAGRGAGRLRPGAQAAQRAAQDGRGRPRSGAGGPAHPGRLGRAPGRRRAPSWWLPGWPGRAMSPPHVAAAYADVRRRRRAGRLVDVRVLASVGRGCRRASPGRDRAGGRDAGRAGAGPAHELDRGISLVGPHRDDLELLLGGGPAKGYASHGESWSFALALRLGSFALLRSDGVDPVLVLDDVFAELDVTRRGPAGRAGRGADQVLITAAVAADVPAELRGARCDVADGQVRRVR